MHACQGEKHIKLHLAQPSPHSIVQVEMALEPEEDAFDAMPLPLQPPLRVSYVEVDEEPAEEHALRRVDGRPPISPLIHILNDMAQLLFENIDQILQQHNLSFHRLKERRRPINTMTTHSSGSS